MTETEQRLFKHVLRLTSMVEILTRDLEQGFADTSLPMHLKVIRQYLSAECPTLLAFVGLVYSGQAVPDGMSVRMEQEAMHGFEAHR